MIRRFRMRFRGLAIRGIWDEWSRPRAGRILGVVSAVAIGAITGCSLLNQQAVPTIVEPEPMPSNETVTVLLGIKTEWLPPECAEQRKESVSFSAQFRGAVRIVCGGVELVIARQNFDGSDQYEWEILPPLDGDIRWRDRTSGDLVEIRTEGMNDQDILRVAQSMVVHRWNGDPGDLMPTKTFDPDDPPARTETTTTYHYPPQ